MRRKTHKGSALLLAVALLAVVMGLTASFVSYHSAVNKATRTYSARSTARQAAMAGIDKAIWCLNRAEGTNCGGTSGFDYIGEANVQVDEESWFTTSVAAVTPNLKSITSTGYYPSAANPAATVVLRAEAIVSTSEASFHYGVQAGNGGFVMDNNAYVDGNIYANGDVLGAQNVYVTGDVWVAGGTALAPDQQSTVNNESYTFGQTSPVIDIAQSFKLSADNVVNKVSFFIRKAGNPGNRTVYILANNAGVPSKTVIGSATLNASAVGTSLSWVDVSFSTPPALVGGQTYWLAIDSSQHSSNYYVIGSQPNSGYGNGIGMSSASWNATTPVWSDANRDFNFKIWTGGVATKIDKVEVRGDAHANTITGSTVKGDAYYQAISGTTVEGTSYPGSPDPGPVDLPLTEVQIAQWKADAASGGTISGNVSYTNGQSVSLGPKRITGNLLVDNNVTLTITGTVHVEGDLTFSNNVVIRLDPAYGVNSGIIMADGKVLISNNVEFEGSGSESSYVLVLTTNPSLDASSPALTLNNNSDNSIFYASKGMAQIMNNAILKEVTAFKLKLENNASVRYESGLANVNFSSGPSGGWTLKEGTVREIR